MLLSSYATVSQTVYLSGTMLGCGGWCRRPSLICVDEELMTDRPQNHVQSKAHSCFPSLPPSPSNSECLDQPHNETVYVRKACDVAWNIKESTSNYRSNHIPRKNTSFSCFVWNHSKIRVFGVGGPARTRTGDLRRVRATSYQTRLRAQMILSVSSS